MLAMISMLVLQTEHGAILPPALSRNKTVTPASTIPLHGFDYFSLTKNGNHTSPMSPTWPHIPSLPAPPMAPSISSSNSSRGSWSSLFNTGSMRQFMHGMQDTFKDGLMTPIELPTTPDIHVTQSNPIDRLSRIPDSPGSAARRRRARKDSSLYSHSPAVVSKSWNDAPNPISRVTTTSFSSAGHKRPLLRFVESNPFIHEKQVVVFEPPIFEES